MVIIVPPFFKYALENMQHIKNIRGSMIPDVFLPYIGEEKFTT